nr:MAG TPA: hypothetical protein [Caudoviricetes sp.]
MVSERTTHLCVSTQQPINHTKQIKDRCITIRSLYDSGRSALYISTFDQSGGLTARKEVEHEKSRTAI